MSTLGYVLALQCGLLGASVRSSVCRTPHLFLITLESLLLYYSTKV